MRTIVQRLFPGQDLLDEILALTLYEKSKSGLILSLVGSLKSANIRFANQKDGTKLEGPFEIVSGTGTIASGKAHIHIALSDDKGKTIGGHLLAGSKVHTTCELVIGDLTSEWTFERQDCSITGYDELIANPVLNK